MHFIISHKCFVNMEVIDIVWFRFLRKRGVKVVNMDLV